MKKRQIISFLLALVLLCSLSLIPAVPAVAQGQTWYVNAITGSDDSGNGSQENPFATIQYAINQVPEGDTIQVAEGDYTENVTIGKALSLTGPEDRTAIIKGTLTIEASDVTVSGFTILRQEPSGGAGIMIRTNKTGIVVRNNVIDGNNVPLKEGKSSPDDKDTGIYIDLCGAVIEGNIIRNNAGNGIWINGKYAIDIINNTITNNRTGINFNRTTQEAAYTITNNEFRANRVHAISIGVGDYIFTIENNSFYEAGESHFSDRRYIDKDDNTVEPSRAIFIEKNTIDSVQEGKYLWHWDVRDGRWLLKPGNIQAAINAASNGDTIEVAAGEYTEGKIVVNKDLTITGDADNKPIIKPESDLKGTNAGNAWFLIEDGVTFTLSNVVLDGGDKWVYQAVRSHGNTTITNVDFKKIRGSEEGYPYRGIAIQSYGGKVPGGGGSDSHGGDSLAPSHLVVENCTFEEIGRIGILVKGDEATAEINNITYTGKGSIDCLDYGIEAGAGGQITVTSSTITNNLGKALSDGSTSAGILVTDFYGTGTRATITDSNLTGNYSGITVGYADDDNSVVEARDNDLSGNIYGLISINPLVDAARNWWGHASGPKHEDTNPTGRGSAVSDNVTFTPWLLVSPDEIGEERENEYTDNAGGTVDFDEAGVTVDMPDDVDGTVTVTTALYSVPADATKPLSEDAEGERALKYVDVKLTDSSYTGDVRITIEYDEADLARMGVEEETLKLYYFKMPNGPWTLATNQALDTVNNKVSGDIPASELSGTPLCLGGEVTISGQYGIGDPPAVTVTFAPTAMDPTFEQTVTVNVSIPEGQGRTLAELEGLTFKVWYDADGGTPTEAEFNNADANTQACAIITWDGADFSLNAGAGSTWSLGTCTAPALTGTSGNFILKFTPGKVALQTTGDAIWQLAAVATSEYGTGFGFDDEGAGMNWYGEVVLGSAVNVDWGYLPAGMDFDNDKAKQALGTTVTYISNGAYQKIARSSATWQGVNGKTAILNTAGTPGDNEFSLKAYNADILNQAVLLDFTSTVIETTTGGTGESGDTDSTNHLWLKLGSTFDQDVYSGTITYLIGNPGS